MIQLLVEFRPVNAYVLRCLVVRYLRIEIGKFGNFDKIPETLFLYNLIGDGKLEIRSFLGIYSRPAVKTCNPLPFHFFGTEIFEQQIEFGQTVGYGRSGQEGGTEVLSGTFLYGTDGEKQVHGLHAAFGISKT